MHSPHLGTIIIAAEPAAAAASCICVLKYVTLPLMAGGLKIKDTSQCQNNIARSERNTILNLAVALGSN